MRTHLPRSISVVTALGTALVLAASTMGPASAEPSTAVAPALDPPGEPGPSLDAVIEGTPPADDPEVIGFVATGGTTIEDVVNSIVEQEGQEAAADFFNAAADQGADFPGLSEADSAEELQAIADFLRTGEALDPDIADQLAEKTSRNALTSQVTSHLPRLVGAMAIEPG